MTWEKCAAPPSATLSATSGGEGAAPALATSEPRGHGENGEKSDGKQLSDPNPYLPGPQPEIVHCLQHIASARDVQSAANQERVHVVRLHPEELVDELFAAHPAGVVPVQDTEDGT
eukprot:CAMPEP_0171143638 /NCGR_PEP_ID=MMETSP0766_2-20121228/144637_1 /TAXON_ID=439317 /ORGANISM="Gambierdiscus australes, Strain CAWD 149" /LENGTH=115 /DNA_ID=CAMNT_0011607469 /DNA_START=268 /DNA_END=617 /DNA_ORIENTATION=+